MQTMKPHRGIKSKALIYLAFSICEELRHEFHRIHIAI